MDREGVPVADRLCNGIGARHLYARLNRAVSSKKVPTLKTIYVYRSIRYYISKPGRNRVGTQRFKGATVGPRNR